MNWLSNAFIFTVPANIYLFLTTRNCSICAARLVMKAVCFWGNLGTINFTVSVMHSYTELEYHSLRQQHYLFTRSMLSEAWTCSAAPQSSYPGLQLEWLASKPSLNFTGLHCAGVPRRRITRRRPCQGILPQCGVRNRNPKHRKHVHARSEIFCVCDKLGFRSL